ncbi:protein yippee-like [Sesamum angolense]|uniref:Protein yippee-like n=1 Tax=Sesamum angolense TaxID=2727404 RepID=A0AAE2BLK3_9LAMI|nr:protein yippee-like [Sesamum angolense]
MAARSNAHFVPRFILKGLLGYAGEILMEMSGYKLVKEKRLKSIIFNIDFLGLGTKGKKWSSISILPCYECYCGPKEDRQLMTGLHTVADVYCGDCREILGWKYEKAYEETQKYKEGKFILEKSKIVKENW